MYQGDKLKKMAAPHAAQQISSPTQPRTPPVSPAKSIAAVLAADIRYSRGYGKAPSDVLGTLQETIKQENVVSQTSISYSNRYISVHNPLLLPPFFFLYYKLVFD